MVMSALQVQTELQRKRNLGIAPTNSANMAQYNALKPMTPPTPTAPVVKPVVPGAPVAGMPASAAKPPGTTPPVTGVPGPVMAGAGAVTPVQTTLATPPPAGTTAAPPPPTPTGFTYNPETDPAYQARKAQIEADVKTGTNNAMVSLGARGIGNSSSAITAAMQQQQQGLSQLQNSVIPELEQQAYQRYNDDLNRKYQEEQLAIQKGQLLGVYESDEMKSLYNEVLQAKQEYANATTPEARAEAHQRAETARAKLTGLNADAGLAGGDVTLDQARGNSSKFGVQTQEAIQNEWNRTHTESRDKKTDDQVTWENNHTDARDKVTDTQTDWENKHTEKQDKLAADQWDKTFNLNNKQVMAELTGHLPDGTLTTAEQQRQLDNLWTAAGQSGVIPDKLADLYGLPHNMKTQAAYQFAKGLSIDWYNAQTSRQNANTNSDQLDLETIKTDAALNGSGNQQTVSPAAAGQILTQSLSKVVGNDPLTGKPVYGTITDPTNREKAFIDAWKTSGVAPGPDTVEMLSKAGYTAAEIAKYQQKYPQVFQQAAQ